MPFLYTNPSAPPYFACSEFVTKILNRAAARGYYAKIYRDKQGWYNVLLRISIPAMRFKSELCKFATIHIRALQMKQGDTVRIKSTSKDCTTRGRTGIVLFFDTRTAEVEFDDKVVS